MSTSGTTTLRRSVLFAFVLPTLVLGIMHGPEGQIPSIYAKHAGISLTALATAILLTKIFDGITYPLIGTLSDRTYARTGTRRSWIIWGSFISMIGVWFLQRPPQGADIFYFGLWTSVIYVGWKVIEIPLQAWSYGLSADYSQRARVQAWRAMAMLAGPFLFYAMPYFAVKAGFSDSTELDFRSLGFSALVCVIAMPLATSIMVLMVPGGTAQPAEQHKKFGNREIAKAVRDNPPLIRLLAAFLPVNLLTGASTGVVLLYLDSYLGLGKQYPAIMMVGLLMTLIGIPFWSAVSGRYERHRVWATSLVIGGIASAGVAAITPGPMALPICFVLYPTLMFCVVGVVIVFTMSADIVDYGRLYTQQDHGGLYGAMFAFLQKSLQGVATAMGLALAGAFGFDATATTQSAGGVFGIKLAMGILPAIGLIGAAAIIWNYPLTRARTKEIQDALAERDGAAAGN